MQTTFKIVLGSQADVIDQPDLLAEHWDEVAKNKQLMVLNPDRRAYKLMEVKGALFTLVAYAGDEIVGYSVNMLSTHIHYKDLLICSNDVIFVKPEYRNTSPLGLRLIKATEKEGLKRGAKLMLWHVKENTSLAAILPRLDYGVQDISFSKQLKE